MNTKAFILIYVTIIVVLSACRTDNNNEETMVCPNCGHTLISYDDSVKTTDPRVISLKKKVKAVEDSLFDALQKLTQESLKRNADSVQIQSMFEKATNIMKYANNLQTSFKKDFPNIKNISEYNNAMSHLQSIITQNSNRIKVLENKQQGKPLNNGFDINTLDPQTKQYIDSLNTIIVNQQKTIIKGETQLHGKDSVIDYWKSQAQRKEETIQKLNGVVSSLKKHNSQIIATSFGIFLIDKQVTTKAKVFGISFHYDYTFNRVNKRCTMYICLSKDLMNSPGQTEILFQRDDSIKISGGYTRYTHKIDDEFIPQDDVNDGTLQTKRISAKPINLSKKESLEPISYTISVYMDLDNDGTFELIGRGNDDLGKRYPTK